MLEFWKNEWNLFLGDLKSLRGAFAKVFGKQEYLMLNSEGASNNEVAENAEATGQVVQPTKKEYTLDEVDKKIETFLGESIDETRENLSADGTQHEVLREYAQFFKPYSENKDMCDSAFKKYYDRHALKIATNEFPIEQARIIQNNVDLFIQGQDIFGTNGQFIDSRVDSIFDKVGINQVNKMVGILHDNEETGIINASGERTFAEVISYMVDNGVKVEKDTDLVEPVKQVLENKLNEVHTSLRGHDDWNEEYQSLLTEERKYLYALNRIEQYETERRIEEFEQKLNDMDVVIE